jgi:hypothetical protein
MIYISLSSFILCIICVCINRFLFMITFMREIKKNNKFMLEKIFDLEIKYKDLYERKNILQEKIIELERKQEKEIKEEEK